MSAALLLPFLSLIGFSLRRHSPWPQQLQKIQTSFLHIWLPFLLFVSMALRKIDIQKSFGRAGQFYATALCFMLFIFLVYRLKPGKVIHPSAAALAATFTNTVMIGAPLFESLGAVEVAELLYLVIPLHALLLFGLASLLCLTIRGRGSFSLRGKFPPITWALALGMAAGYLTEGNLPGAEIIRLVTGTILQYSTFFVLGIALGRLSSKRFTQGDVWFLAGLKLIITPLFFYSLYRLFNFQSYKAATVISALPIGMNVLAFSNQFGTDTHEVTSAAIIMSTVGALVTMPLLLYAFGYLP